MKKLFFLLSIFAIVLSCSSDETSTPVTPPSAPIAKYTITLSAGEGGTVSTTGGEYEAGQTVSVTATPQGEYVFTSWSDGNTNATRTITIGSNSTLTANFEKRKYPLTINFEGEGEVLEEIVNAGRTTEYDSGTTVKLTAQAAAEWVFVGWTGDIESTEESVQIVIGEPKEVTATFEKKKYPLTVNIEGEGEVLEEIVDAGRTTDYNSGTTVKLTAQPTDEWLFTGWSGDIGDIDPTENPIQLNIIESKTVTATFEKKKYPLTVNIEGEGEVIEEIVNAGRTTDYDSGTIVKLTAQPEDEWLFTGWSGDIGDIDPTENPIQLSIIESKTVTATFEKKKYPLTLNIEGEGEVLEEIVNSGRTTDYNSGTTVKLTAVPAEGWVFVGWTGDIGDIEPTENPIQLSIIESKTVTATFEKKKYPLTVNIDGEGEVLEEIVNSGRTTDYDSGTTVKLTAQPEDEWLFTGWSGDIGDIDPTENPIQLSIIESKTVTATFEKKKYPLTVNIDGEGEVLEEIVNSGRTTDYDSGTTVKLTAQPEDEWLFTGWSGDIGDIDPTENPIQLSIIESKTVTATFEKKKYPLTLNIEGEGEVLEEIVNSGRTTDYNSGTTVKLTAVPAEGWVFVGWTGAIESTELEIQLLVSGTKTVSASFSLVQSNEIYYSSGDIVPIEPIIFYNRKLDVNGVKLIAAGEIGGQEAVPNFWIYKTARVFKLLTDKDGEDIDANSQLNMIKTLKGEIGWHQGRPAGQRIARGGGNEYSPNFLDDNRNQSYPGIEAFEDALALDDMVWYKNIDSKGTGDDDINEIIEHILHTLHRFGVRGGVEGSTEALNIEAEEEDITNTDIFLAMKEAYTNGVFGIEGYGGDINNRDAWPVMLKEYQYLLTYGMWEFSEFWDGGSLSPEWNDNARTPSGILANNPLGYALYNKYFAPVISKPSKEVLRTIFQDNDQGESGYIPD